MQKPLHSFNALRATFLYVLAAPQTLLLLFLFLPSFPPAPLAPFSPCAPPPVSRCWGFCSSLTLQNIRRNMTNEQLKRRADHLEGLKVLDVGCGGGILSEELCRMGGDVTGIDASPQNVRSLSLSLPPLVSPYPLTYLSAPFLLPSISYTRSSNGRATCGLAAPEGGRRGRGKGRQPAVPSSDHHTAPPGTPGREERGRMMWWCAARCVW
eukprot:953954-Rhodomonas_salina.1